MRVQLLAVVALAFAATTGSAQAATATYSGGTITNLTTSCSTQNAEVEQAVDTNLGYVYEDWMGCNGIGFSRSVDR
jgi:hypothetical protein